MRNSDPKYQYMSNRCFGGKLTQSVIMRRPVLNPKTSNRCKLVEKGLFCFHDTALLLLFLKDTGAVRRTAVPPARKNTPKSASIDIPPTALYYPDSTSKGACHVNLFQ